ncbi:MAG: hypothetical protein D3914_04470 [Candidatus Electrothrix sp. LOE2]|jgi:hypothetical protein|nr:hypothetical protein [Candidatus Electrothrix sp. LOE2]
MPTTLTLQIPDRIYRPLQKKAVQRGKTLDQIIIEWLGNAVTDEPDDPLLRLAGAFSSDVKDISTNHDSYIGQELSNVHE